MRNWDLEPARLAFVGSFTTEERRARGKGIGIFRIGGREWGDSSHLAVLGNPSYLVIGARNDILYCVYGDGRYASAYAIDPEHGGLRLLNHVSTGGLNGVYCAIHPAGQFLLVANHDSGSLTVLPIMKDGRLGDPTQVFDLPGQSGPRREQRGAQPHQVVFDRSGTLVIVPAKGLDQILLLDFDPVAGRIRMRDSGHAVMRPGAGPRHIAVHPSLPVLFAVNEIESSVALCGWSEAQARIDPLSIIPSLPDDAMMANTASAIMVSSDGRDIYVSNRGHDSIAHLRFDPAAMRLSPIAWVPANGRCPRFMTWLPGSGDLVVAAEDDDRITIFKRDAVSGLLTLDRIVASCGSPSAIDFI